MRAFSGVCAASARRSLTPSAPRTFAISWGSWITLVTPFGTTAAPYRGSETIEDSTCTWASISPGAT